MLLLLTSVSLFCIVVLFCLKDISDLFGSDLPTDGEGEQKMKFTWRDGPFLKALKNSEWILLDEVQRSVYVV